MSCGSSSFGNLAMVSVSNARQSTAMGFNCWAERVIPLLLLAMAIPHRMACPAFTSGKEMWSLPLTALAVTTRFSEPQ